MPDEALQSHLNLLPHGPSFRFLSRLLSLEPGTSGRALWDVSGDEPFFTGHFPGQPIVPGVLLAESLAQLCGVVAFAGTELTATPARLAQIDVKVHAGVVPPASIELSATLNRRMGNLVLFDVEASVAGSAAASGRLVLASL